MVLLTRNARIIRMEQVDELAKLDARYAAGENITVGEANEARERTGTFLTLRVGGFPDLRVRVDEGMAGTAWDLMSGTERLVLTVSTEGP